MFYGVCEMKYFARIVEGEIQSSKELIQMHFQ